MLARRRERILPEEPMTQNRKRDAVMNNREIYQKTVGFSIRRLLWDIAAFLILAVLAGARD